MGTSCSKQESGDQIIETNAILQFSISGIRDIEPVAMASGSGKRINNTRKIQHSEYQEFEALSYFELESQHKSTSIDRQANTEMAPEVRYRDELYEVNGASEKHWRTLNLTANASRSSIWEKIQVVCLLLQYR